MDSIAKISFSFKGEHPDFFHSLYGQWDNAVMPGVEKATAEVLSHYSNDDEQLEINKIEVDLGNIDSEAFIKYFAYLYREKLLETLGRYIANADMYNIKRTSKRKKLSEILCHFLLYGTLPWDIEMQYKDINLLFIEVAGNDGTTLKKFLLTYGHYTSLQQRLIFQLSDTALHQGIRLIAPAEGGFITSYITFLQAKYKVIDKPAVTASNHRDAIWQVVYTYLLSNKSSLFNKKSFLKYTISALADRYNITYNDLLKMLVIEVKGNPDVAFKDSELYGLLKLLKHETPDSYFEGALTDIARIYKLMLPSGKDKLSTHKADIKVLRDILRREDSCRSFLAGLTEAEIITLVKVILPQDHVFVIRYATTLGRQKENGLLQGKAGSEFRLIKWQIIFPLLIEQATFNRKYFVMKTLQGVASHYNLSIEEILHYFITEKQKQLRLDKTLIEILRLLYDEITHKPIPEAIFTTAYDTAVKVANAIKTGKKPEPKALSLLKHRLADTSFRESVIGLLNTESEQQFFIKILFPVQADIITAYATGLGIYNKKKSLESGGGDRFRQIKWRFIHAVLFEPRQNVFNNKYFVWQVLARIASHYNQKATDLLSYFYNEVIRPGNIFSFELTGTLKELYEERVAIPKQTALHTEAEKNTIAVKSARKRLEHYFGSSPDAVFIIDALAEKHGFVNFIENVLRAELLLRNFFKTEMQLLPDYKAILKILLRFSTQSAPLSRIAIMARILLYYSGLVTGNMQAGMFRKEMERLVKDNLLLRETADYMANATTLPPTNPAGPILPGLKEITDMDAPHQTLENYINNAGLVILHPYLPRLFGMLSFTENGKFVNEEAQLRALFVMQYAVFGTTQSPEHEMQLNKLLAGVKTETPIPSSVELTEHEKDTVNSLLMAVIDTWRKLGKTSVEGLRETFLARSGRLSEHEDFYQLDVEEKAFDILMVSLPWSISHIKYSWMEKGINIKWR